MATDYNVKHPKLPFLGKYPNLHVSQDAAGNQILKSLEPGKEAYFEVMASGSYYGHAADGSKVEAVVGKTHNYHADGVSVTADGHHDQKVSGSMRSNSDGGRHSENAGDHYEGGGGHKVSTSQDSGVSHSSGDVYASTEGNHVTQHDGSYHTAIKGDYVQSVTGHKMDVVTGEYGVNVQGGNYDVNVSKKIKIEASEEIELRVGKNTINIYPNGIAIQADGGFMNIYVINSGQNLVIDNKGSGKTGIFAENNEMIMSGKSNKIKSAQGTLLEVSVAPPGGQIKPT